MNLQDRIDELKDTIKDLQEYEDNWNGDCEKSCINGEIIYWEDKIGELNEAKEELEKLLVEQENRNQGKDPDSKYESWKDNQIGG